MPPPLNFKQLAQDIDIAEVAHLLKLEPHKDRFACPTCDNDRAIQLFPETNSFRCHIAKISGDCISLYGHANNYVGQYRAAKELSEHFQTAKAAGALTAPQKPAGGKQPAAPKEEITFDPEKFAAKLTYTDEVSALGLSEADATRLGIGVTRGKLYLALRDEFGFTTGFVAYAEGQLKMPPKLLPNPNVVKLRRA